MIELRHGDALAPACLPSLADASVDVVITDPPFDARTHRVAKEGAPLGEVRRMSAPLPFAPFDAAKVDAVARELVRVTRRWLLVFVAERQLELWAAALEQHGGRFVRVGYAVRTNPRPQLTGDRPAPGVDSFVIAHRAGLERMRWNARGKAGVWRSPPSRWDTGGRSVHPTQKPLELMRELVRDFTNAGDLVVDPFAGSATTGLACKLEGRRFLGWELDANFYAIGRARLSGIDRNQVDGRPKRRRGEVPRIDRVQVDAQMELLTDGSAR